MKVRTAKILIFIHSLKGGGAERICSYLANHWAGSEADVLLVTIDSPSLDDYELDLDVARVSLDMAVESTSPFAAVANNLRLICKLRSVLKKSEADVAISFMTRANIVCAVACIGARAFHIASERNYPALDNHGRFWNTLRKQTYRFANVVVAQTEKGRLWLDNETSARNVVAIPNPVVYPLPGGEGLVPEYDIPVGRMILAVGRLSPQKQFDQLMNAFATLAGGLDNWQLVIVGEGQERDKLVALSVSLGIKNRVHLPGRVKAVSMWYRRADIFVLSSKYEGFPNALVEAMSYGLPVISYDCDTGPAELIESGVNGYLVENNNEVELYKKLEKLAIDSELRVLFGRKACLLYTSPSPRD